jgi:hypothetical protein
MTHVVVHRFPLYAVLVTTSAPPTAVVALLESAMSANAGASGITPASRFTFTFRIAYPPWCRALAPVVRGEVVPSAGGSNVYFAVRADAFWRLLHLLLVAAVIGGFALSFAWGELLFVPWLSAFVLAISVRAMWVDAQETIDRLESVLPNGQRAREAV